jgi:hypothetical protein
MVDINTIIFFILFLVQTIWDLVFRKDTIHCISNINGMVRRIKFVLFTILHHLLSVFLLVGWIMNSKIIIIIYLFTIVIVFGSWQITDGLCWMTVLQNNMCGCNKKKPFNHLLQLMKIKETQKNKKYYYGIIIIGIVVSFYKLIM